MELSKLWKGVLLAFVIAVPAWLLGKQFEVIGGPVFAILIGMILALVVPQHTTQQLLPGIQVVSKKVLQWAVILLGFGLNLTQIAQVGATSLPVIVSTISTALITAFIVAKLMHIPAKIATLVGVGSSICGGSAIAATAPVIDADDEEIAQAISVIFLFNVIAALVFPTFGSMLGLSNEGFGLFAGTAVNDTSSVTAAAAAWDGMHPGSNALDIATIVKLTRTLAIIPITLVLGIYYAHTSAKAAAQEALQGTSQEASQVASDGASKIDGKIQDAQRFSIKKVVPTFVIFFILASVITTVFALPATVTVPLKTLSKFMIVLAMAAIGFNTNLLKLIKSGGKPILLGFICWVAIACVSLLAQHLIGVW